MSAYVGIYLIQCHYTLSYKNEIRVYICNALDKIKSTCNTQQYWGSCGMLLKT